MPLGWGSHRSRRASSCALGRRLGPVDTLPAALHRFASHLALMGELEAAVADWFMKLGIHKLVDVELHGLP